MYLENLLLIGGSSQNVGKTTFAINLLNLFSKNYNIIAIKTSCHFHGILNTDIVISNNEEFTIVKETVTNTGKDSARMLNAGAKEVYFIQAKDEFIEKAFLYLYEKIDNNNLIICETASLRKYIIPEVFIALVNNKNHKLNSNKSILKKADFTIENYLNIEYDISSVIDINNNKWTIK